jgi:hypothetical protein
MDKAQKTISELMVLLGTAIGSMKCLASVTIADATVHKQLKEIIKILEKGSDRILKEIDYE